MDDFALAPDLFFPWLNSAGSLGFLPPAEWNWPRPAGAFLTPPLSYKPRTPAEDRTALHFAGGCLLHSGLPNPGLRTAVKQYGARWACLKLPVWIHLIADDPRELANMVHTCENLENVMALEIGLPPFGTAQECLDLLDAAAGELPLIAHIPLERAGEAWLAELPRHGVGALSLGAPRGVLPSPIQAGKWISGRLFGNALFPQVLFAVQKLNGFNLSIIAGSGIFSPIEGEALIQAGAWAVALDTVLWNPFPIE